MRITLRTARDRPTAPLPPSAIEIDEIGQLVLLGRRDRVAGRPERSRQQGRSVGRRRERLPAGRVVDDADGRAPIHDEPDRHAEERDAVRVVHRAVQRIDDPEPAPTGRWGLAGDRPMLPALLGQDRVAWVARTDGVDDQLLRQVVGLGHDVAGALVMDPLEALVAVHQHLAGAGRERQPERQVVRAAGDAIGCGRCHGVRHVTASSRASVPNSVTTVGKPRV